MSERIKSHSTRNKFYNNTENVVVSTIPSIVSSTPDDVWVKSIEDGFGVKFSHNEFSKDRVDVNIYCIQVSADSSKTRYLPIQPVIAPAQSVSNDPEKVSIRVEETVEGDDHVHASFSNAITFLGASEQISYIFRKYFTESLPPLFDSRFAPDYFRCVDIDTGEIVSFGFDVIKRTAREVSSVYLSSTKLPPNKRANSTSLLRIELGKTFDDEGNPKFMNPETKEPLMKDHWRVSEERFFIQKQNTVGNHQYFTGNNRIYPSRNVYVDASIGTFAKNPHYFQADEDSLPSLKKTKRRICMDVYFVFPETPKTENITTPTWIPFGVYFESEPIKDNSSGHQEWNVFDSMFGVQDKDHFWNQIQEIVTEAESKSLLSKLGNTKLCYSTGGMLCLPPDSNYFDHYLPFDEASFNLYFTLDPSDLIRHVFKIIDHPHLHPFLRLISDVVVENCFFFILEKMQRSLRTMSKSKQWEFYQVAIDGYRNLKNRKNFMVGWYCFNNTDTIQSYVASLLVMFAQISFIEDKIENERQANIIYQQLCQKEEDSQSKKKRKSWSKRRRHNNRKQEHTMEKEKAMSTTAVEPTVVEPPPIVVFEENLKDHSELSRILSILDSPNERNVRELSVSFRDYDPLVTDSTLLICFTCFGRKSVDEMSNRNICKICAPFSATKFGKIN